MYWKWLLRNTFITSFWDVICSLLPSMANIKSLHRYSHSAYIPTHIANVMFKNTDQVIIRYGTHHKECKSFLGDKTSMTHFHPDSVIFWPSKMESFLVLKLKPCIRNFPSNVIMYLRAVSQFFNDDYVQLNTRYDFSWLLIGPLESILIGW